MNDAEHEAMRANGWSLDTPREHRLRRRIDGLRDECTRKEERIHMLEGRLRHWERRFIEVSEELRAAAPGSICIFKHCLEGIHISCIRYGPAPNTVGGSRVVCGCPCHTGQDPDWKPSDADRMATSIAFEFGVDPRVEQIVEGEFRG